MKKPELFDLSMVVCVSIVSFTAGALVGRFWYPLTRFLDG